MNGRRVPLVAVLVVVAVALDLVAFTAVLSDRRNAPSVPRFDVARLTSVDWKVSPYAGRSNAFGFTINPGYPAQVAPSGQIDYRDRVNPTLNAEYALACLDRAQGPDSTLWVTRAKTAVQQVLATAHEGLLPYDLPDSDPFGDALPVPGYSAATQGLVLSALARLYDVTGDRRWQRDATPVFEALLRFRDFFEGSKPAPEPWLSLVDGDGDVWFEHFTNLRAPVRSVSDELLTMFGVLDFHRSLATRQSLVRRSSQLFAGGLATVQRNLPRVRRPGQLALSSLSAGTSDIRSHQVLKVGTAVLGEILSDPSYQDLSQQLDKDDNLAPFTVGPVRVVPAGSPFAPLPAGFGYSSELTGGDRLDPSGVVLSASGTVRPGRTATYALAALDRYRTTRDRTWLTRAARAVTGSLARAPSDHMVPSNFAQTDALGAHLPSPWYSADVQGLLLAAASRLTVVTGDDEWRRRAVELFSTLPRFRDFGPDGQEPPRPWDSLVDDSGYLWFEAYPSDNPPSLLLHVQLSTLLALYEYGSLTRDPVARRMFLGGVTTVRHYLPRMLRSPGQPWDSLAARTPEPAVQPLLTAQLQTLAGLTGDRVIEHYAGPRTAG